MHKQILLTGATGALGPALAAELARGDAAARIAILMRAPGTELRERFDKWLAVVRPLVGPDHENKLERLFPVSGDICQDDLGLENAGRDLQRDTDVVIHAAADTNFNAPPERQHAVNVEGTRRTLDWSRQCPRLERFILVSSVFVSGSCTGRIDETLAADPPDFVTHYQRTKWEAEHVAFGSGLPVGVARISLILGSHATGGVHRPGAVHSLIKWFSRGLVPMLPGIADARGDLIATEIATQFLMRALHAKWNAADGIPIWHIAAADDAPKMTELIDFVYQQFADRPAWRKRNIPRPQMVEQQRFDEFVNSFSETAHPAVAQAMRSVNTFLPDLNFPKTYDTTRAEALWGGPLPRYDWRETMERVIRVLCPER